MKQFSVQSNQYRFHGNAFVKKSLAKIFGFLVNNGLLLVFVSDFSFIQIGDQRSEIDPCAKLDKQHGSSNFDPEQYREMLDDLILMP